MPSSRALFVIMIAKSSSVPARKAPIAEATSLAERVTSARIASSTLMVWPGRSPSFDGGMPAPRGVMAMRDFNVNLLESNPSNRR